MHVSAQKLMQKNKNKYKILLFSATNGPFTYLSETEWNSENAISKLTDKNTCKGYYKYTFIKLRSHERNLMNKNENMNNAFSNLQIK
jgi:hypothetical protein